MQLKTKIVIGILVVIGIVYFISKNKKRSKQIQFHEIESVITQLLNAENPEHEFFAITTDGVNRLAFTKNNNGKIDIEFLVQTDEQKSYAERFIDFAKNNDYVLTQKTIGNKNPSKINEPTIFYRLELDADKSKAATIGIEIMKTVFDKNENTKFDIFP